MLNIGWSEMLIIAAIALIVVGPKDLPALLRQLGSAFSTVRRMGNEFKSELTKVAAIDEFKDAKKSITDPLNQTSKQISDEFNKVSDGGVEPTGKIKPKVDGSESVADEIREAAGLPPVPQPDHEAAASSMKAAVQRGQARAAEAAAQAEAQRLQLKPRPLRTKPRRHRPQLCQKRQKQRQIPKHQPKRHPLESVRPPRNLHQLPNPALAASPRQQPQPKSRQRLKKLRQLSLR